MGSRMPATKPSGRATPRLLDSQGGPLVRGGLVRAASAPLPTPQEGGGPRPPCTPLATRPSPARRGTGPGSTHRCQAVPVRRGGGKRGPPGRHPPSACCVVACHFIWRAMSRMGRRGRTSRGLMCAKPDPRCRVAHPPVCPLDAGSEGRRSARSDLGAGCRERRTPKASGATWGLRRLDGSSRRPGCRERRARSAWSDLGAGCRERRTPKASGATWGLRRQDGGSRRPEAPGWKKPKA